VDGEPSPGGGEHPASTPRLHLHPLCLLTHGPPTRVTPKPLCSWHPWLGDAAAGCPAPGGLCGSGMPLPCPLQGVPGPPPRVCPAPGIPASCTEGLRWWRC